MFVAQMPVHLANQNPAVFVANPPGLAKAKFRSNSGVEFLFGLDAARLGRCAGLGFDERPGFSRNSIKTRRNIGVFVGGSLFAGGFDYQLSFGQSFSSSIAHLQRANPEGK